MIKTAAKNGHPRIRKMSSPYRNMISVLDGAIFMGPLFNSALADLCARTLFPALRNISECCSIYPVGAVYSLTEMRGASNRAP
jgi:hypothetical protein